MMGQEMFQAWTGREKPLTAATSVRKYLVFIIGLGLLSLILAALMVFPMVSRADANADRGRSLF